PRLRHLTPGQVYTAETLDQALKDLYATQLFADVNIAGTETGDLVINVRENPVINRIILEGNKRLKEDKILPEIKLAPRQIFTRQAGGVLGFLKSNDTYDPDRLAADQQKLRAFYLTQGYADFRVVSALAELTPDRKDFVITYVVEEGPRYKFGTINAESALRDFPASTIKQSLKIKSGDWFNAKTAEDTVTDLNEKAANLGYAFADINPSYDRDAEHHVMNLTIRVGETPRVYVERIDITGNTSTRDKVIRREFRLNEA